MTFTGVTFLGRGGPRQLASASHYAKTGRRAVAARRKRTLGWGHFITSSAPSRTDSLQAGQGQADMRPYQQVCTRNSQSGVIPDVGEIFGWLVSGLELPGSPAVVAKFPREGKSRHEYADSSKTVKSERPPPYIPADQFHSAISAVRSS